MRRSPLAVAIASVALVSACASPTAPAPTSTQPTGTQPTSTQPTTGHGAYAACLAKNGVSTPPAGPGAPPGVDATTWAKAQMACAAEAPGPA